MKVSRDQENLSWVSFSARLFQVKMEREQHQTEIRDLQDQLSEMHDELDSAKQSEDREKGALIEVSWGWVTRGALSVRRCGWGVRCLVCAYSIGEHGSLL